MFFSVITHNVKAGGTGSCSPSATGSYKNEWLNPTNAYSQNDVYARGTTSTADEQDYYNFGFSFTNFDRVLGIVVSIDGYGSSSGCSYYAKLSWNGGTSWSSEKQSGNLGTSDTDTYINIGGATDTWGRTWATESELSNANFRLYLRVYQILAGRYIYTDHIYIYIYYEGYPSVLTNMYTVSQNCSKDVNISCIGSTYNFNDYNDYVRIQRKTTGFPSNIGDGTNIYNGTLPMTGDGYLYYVDTTVNYNTFYYYSAWAYNRTYKLWSSDYAYDKIRTSCEVEIDLHDNINIIDAQNISYVTEWDYYFDGTTYIINYYFNGSVSQPTFRNYENIINATGTHESSLHKIIGYWYYDTWANYTGNTTTCNSTDINLFKNIINATGTLEYEYNSITGFKIWANYTGNTTGCPSCNSTDLILYENIINATGIHQSLYNPVTGWKVWANYTGNVSLGNCSGIYWYNYTDDNVTINVSFNKQTNSFIDDYTINEENWLNIAGALLLDNSQFFIIILLALWLFFISKYLEHKDVIVALMQFGLSIPLTIVISVISLSYAFGYIIVFLIPIISLVLLADGFFYSKRKR